MRLCRIVGAGIGALTAVALFGCSSQSTLTNQEVSQIKTKPTDGIPDYGRKAMADKAAEGQRLYEEHLKKTGGGGPGGPPPGATQGPPAGATQGPPPGAGGPS